MTDRRRLRYALARAEMDDLTAEMLYAAYDPRSDYTQADCDDARETAEEATDAC